MVGSTAIAAIPICRDSEIDLRQSNALHGSNKAFKEGAGNVFLRHADTHTRHLNNISFIASRSSVSLREPTGSE